MELEDDQGQHELQLAIMAKLGSYPNILRRPDVVPLHRIRGYHVHEIPGHGNILCSKMGIIEPITQSMQNCFSFMPQEMLKLCRWAVKENVFPLCWRLGIAAESQTSITDPTVAQFASEAVGILSTAVKDAINRLTH